MVVARLLQLFIEMVQWRKVGVLLEQNVALKPPWQPGLQLVRGVTSSGNTEDVIEFLEGALPERSLR